ncbi:MULTISPECIES: DsbA family protein [Hymenobacter]|uniref:DsbA family protein n=1 Tax=Hymenobacter armeniacus TaxID=2771358 RepID=A0ABR8K1J8_9BACT|nr:MULTISPECIES: DsbA family protein [Hymenobacter]MBD2724254.1 DsbA family protein [Hymenobacter armeniacus]MBJ6111558.1 DsbA family protein [Hymenobacter sp. BT523]
MTPETTPPAHLPELLYIQDPLCGWCYGTSPVIQRLQADFAGRVDVSVLCGGMVKGEDVGPIGEVWPDLRRSLHDVEEVTGVQFGAAFKALGEAGDYVYDSEPPCRAIAAFRQLTQDPARTVAFAHAVQVALFRDGQDLNNPSVYNDLLAPFGVDVVAFQQRWASPETARAAQQEFAAVARSGVEGFPTAVVRVAEQGYVLARGYQPYEQLRAGLEQLLAQEGA